MSAAVDDKRTSTLPLATDKPALPLTVDDAYVVAKFATWQQYPFRNNAPVLFDEEVAHGCVELAVPYM